MFLLERMKHWARETPNNPAVVFEGETITFSDFQSKVQSVVVVLFEEYGIKAGDRIAYLGTNHPDILYLVFACSHLGAIFTPFNTRLAEDEYAFLIDNSEPNLCFYDGDFEKIADKKSDTKCRFVSTNELKRGNETSPQPPCHQVESDPLLLVYTSGTTGRPKGALLSNEAVAANIENGNALYNFAANQNILITLPLFHVGGLCILLLPALSNGATIYLHSRFDPAATLASLSNENITTSIFVPAQMAAMMEHALWECSDMSSMKYVVVGSSRIPMSQIKAWHAKNIPVSQVYGATETGPTVIGLPLEHAASKAGSAGKVAKLCTIDVRRVDKSSCNVAEAGNIWVRGPNILSMYWRNQDETDLVLHDGWYDTGDIGYIDEDGFYWIVDRSKDVIISGGENIYPAEIEAVGLHHPSILAIAVVGKADAHWGEIPIAAVELKPKEKLDEEGFQKFLAGKIARFKQPKSIVFFDKLPRNGMGKIEKGEIRKIVNL